MLTGKNAIITGAGGGIGRATIETFAKNGANVWAMELRDSESFRAFRSEIGSKYSTRIEGVFGDITQEEEVKKAVLEIKKDARQIDILANVAGIVAPSSSFTMTGLAKMQKVFDVNFFALSLISQYVARIMQRQKNGSIINISSIAGIDGRPGQYEYASSKAAVIGATKELARELGPYNIRVNAIAPGMIDTSMGAQISDELKDTVMQQVIMKRMGKPEEIANVIAFLGSDLSSFINGQVIRVDGGM